AAGSAATRPAAGRIVAAAFAAAAAVHLSFGVRELVAEAAFEPAAQAGQLRRVEAQVLLLRHLDRHRLERGEECRAAERTAAGAVAAHHLGFVADADLPHLDSRAELGRELADELPEVDASVSGEIKNQFRAVERLLDARQLHAETPLAELHHRDAVCFALAMLVLEPAYDVVAARETDHAVRRVGRRATPLLKFRDGSHDRTDGESGFCVDDD